ncbi:hypothetical protein AGLY_016390 [Aphis glycines]|uniref:Uncharacterized protein n=1 Tax=Aphis glycines TaxID=307491 RepID=A0A6G0SXX7_APHGL|nr:hypothetical protein AGLY_016390 [Aphis glycines]
MMSPIGIIALNSGADNIACNKTQKDDSKDLRSDVKEKSASLCKEPKSLNGNQSDGENYTGECLKQKISQHKTKTSTTDKSETSFSNHKSNTKDNICKEVVAKSKDINNKANNIIYKLKDNGTKSKEFMDKPKEVITKPKVVIDKSKEVINKPKNIIDKSKYFNKPKDIVEKSKNIINKTKHMVDKSKDKLFLSRNSNSNNSKPKLLNSNRSDDESNAGGSSKQESTIRKNKSSSTDKTKSSSSYHKSSRKDNISTIVKNNCNDSKRLKLSQPKTNKLFINNEIIEESKSEKLEDPELNDFRSSTITNDEQDAANVLLSMSTISYESSQSEIITENILFIENSPPITETLKTHKIENELKKENIDHTKIVPSSNNNDIKENSELKPINSEKSILLKNSLKGVPTVPSHLFEKECSVNLKRYSYKNINIQSCPSNNVEITNEHQKSYEIVMDEKELKTLNVEVNLDPNENDKTNECNSNAILKVPKLKIKLLPNQIDSINKCKRKKHHKDKESKKLKLSKSLNIPSEDSVLKNIMFEKLDQKFNNNTEVKMNDSASTLSKQTSYKEIENNSVVVLDDDKSHCSFKGFSEAETIPCKNYKILKSVIKALQAMIHEHDVINDGFKGFTNVETHPCKHRDIVYAELIKLKDSICSTDFDFIGFSEEETQISNGHKYVIQQLELAKKQFGSNRKHNGKIFNEVVTAYLYESHNDSDATSRAIYSKSINDDKKDCTTENNINNKHDNWVVEQEIKYKLLPAKVTLERLGRIEYGCRSSKHVSDSSHVPI